ncbi:MAG: DUF72 domain-containing protein [Paludisphaera borealis]|uniref:DUF72 domain-containing protein n=1 Tax=Paludisphaera borealis TaxID=1387353 RepID=UPI0028422616|nr:DUF72 domain-containing protein [Paludisphaera borealis]MDR3621120.1 DUF72 domain-containing protein [Paludisphaera borealis]
MAQLSLFDSEPDDDPPARAASLAPKLRALAEKNLFFGTSSWKYEGWLGSIYRSDRYETRGRFSQKKFESECLREYGKVFPVVGGDFSFYQFPSAAYWKTLFDDAPEPLRFGLKVPEEVTVPRWPQHARYGSRAGKVNEGFLDAKLFKELFARPLWRHRDRVAVLMFEFGAIARSTFAKPEDFYERLGPFLDELPPGFRYSVEVRNPEYLGADYFSLLRAHNTAHLFNAWTRMPEPLEQIDMPGAFTADFSVARALLKHGRPYAQAVERFSPYRSVQEPNPAVRKALRIIAERSWRASQPAFLFVNNRIEGYAPGTIEAVVDDLTI